MNCSTKAGIKPVLLLLACLCGCASAYPEWITWETAECTVNGEHFELRERTVYLNGTRLFDEDWKCAKMLACDLDQDEQEDILFLIWNHQDYGDHHPFWEEKDETALSEHLYIYHVPDGRPVPMWMSSRLDVSIQDIRTEGSLLYVTEADGQESLWEWAGYSIRRIDP